MIEVKTENGSVELDMEGKAPILLADLACIAKCVIITIADDCRDVDRAREVLKKALIAELDRMEFDGYEAVEV